MAAMAEKKTRERDRKNCERVHYTSDWVWGLEIAFWSDFDLMRAQNEILFLKTLHKYNIHRRRCSNRSNIIKCTAHTFSSIEILNKILFAHMQSIDGKATMLQHFLFCNYNFPTFCSSSAFQPHSGSNFSWWMPERKRSLWFLRRAP